MKENLMKQIQCLHLRESLWKNLSATLEILYPLAAASNPGFFYENFTVLFDPYQPVGRNIDQIVTHKYKKMIASKESEQRFGFLEV